jgi:hypothetical protein
MSRDDLTNKVFGHYIEEGKVPTLSVYRKRIDKK